MSNVLLDKIFLRQLDEWRQKEVYVKIISLDFTEKPRFEIEGFATGGSINVDGASASRRSCSLTMITNNAKVNELDWALETKFKLFIGLKNFLDDKYRKEGIVPLFNEDHSLVLDKEKKPIYRPVYEEIIWFPQGTYVLTSLGTSYNAQGFSISLQGKDKMCLLDGTVGGNLFASHDFGKIEVQKEGSFVNYEQILIYDIIKNAIHEYANEPYENIIIKDLEDCAVELISYKLKNVDLIVYDYSDDECLTYITQIVFSIDEELYNKLKAQPLDVFIDSNTTTAQGNTIYYRKVKEVTYGDTVGYRLTDLTYVGDLILGVGASVTQMLDSLVNMLGEFEYFYDLDGRFVFRRKPIYCNISWTNAITNGSETHYDNVDNGSENVYEFTQGVLIESYNNKPNINNIKNDYSIWGNFIASDGDNLPCHLRCAIDDKPTYYQCLSEPGQPIYAVSAGIVDSNGNLLENAIIVDWRELIYLMAKDYSISDTKIMEYTKLINESIKDEDIDNAKIELAKWEATWNTKYIAYYTDMLGFWRLLYDPSNSEWSSNNHWNPDYIKAINVYEYIKDKNGIWYWTGAEWVADSLGNHDGEPHTRVLIDTKLEIVNHESFIFWIDFIDNGYLEKYKPSNIGRRTKSINDTEIKAIFYEDTPNILFIDPNEDLKEQETSLGYIKMNLSGSLANYFNISAQGKSAAEELDSLLYNHTYYCESITLNCIPIYYLEPNTRISVYDETSGINGDYFIKSYSIQLAYNGSMSITATKADDLII